MPVRREQTCCSLATRISALALVGMAGQFDISESGCVPMHLSEVHRFAGRIARAANAIKDGKPWAPSKRTRLRRFGTQNLRILKPE